jgi:lysophospholipase L1-like esterase
MSLIFKPKETIEFIGDSITDCGRREPELAPLGDGYVRDINNLLQAGYPELKLKVLNYGISGDRATNLRPRWKSDVLEVKPDWLFIYIGINDVWRYFEGDPSEAVDLPEFECILGQLIQDTLTKTESQIRLISPFLAETNHEDTFRMKLSNYQASIDRLGEALNIPVIHLQPAFDWAMLSKPSSDLSTDRVHPTGIGHMLIALTILRACGFSL